VKKIQVLIVIEKVLVRTITHAVIGKVIYISTLQVKSPKNPLFHAGTDQYKQGTNKPFGDGTARLASRGRARALPVAEGARAPAQGKGSLQAAALQATIANCGPREVRFLNPDQKPLYIKGFLLLGALFGLEIAEKLLVLMKLFVLH